MPLSTNSRPGLSSIDANLPELGRQAAQRVFEAIDGVEIPRGEHHVPVRLVVRGSTVVRR
ncbi:substrate-binding domain-containing protein [Agrococcus versicolor]|uniref:substrate-binding domain-containing protein n=1 Tax=Agrococcus versicolor TaxID=501482 RepID=UPI0031E27073